MSLILPLKTDDIYIVDEMMITLLTENGTTATMHIQRESCLMTKAGAELDQGTDQ